MSVVSAPTYRIGSPAMSTRVTCGSRMPSGRLPRICAIALRTSLTARSVGVPIWNWTKVVAVAFADRAVDLVDAVDAADRGFDPLRDLGLHLVRRGARLGDGDDRRREIDVRIVVHLHPRERDQAGQHQPDEQDDRRNRVADAPGRDVAEIHGYQLFLSASARGLALRVHLLARVEERPGRQHDRLLAAEVPRRWSRRCRRPCRS